MERRVVIHLPEVDTKVKRRIELQEEPTRRLIFHAMERVLEVLWERDCVLDDKRISELLTEN